MGPSRVQLSICCLCCSFRECINKFGDEWGEKVWNAVNDCFDAMPMAATVDGKVSMHCSWFLEMYEPSCVYFIWILYDFYCITLC